MLNSYSGSKIERPLIGLYTYLYTFCEIVVKKKCTLSLTNLDNIVNVLLVVEKAKWKVYNCKYFYVGKAMWAKYHLLILFKIAEVSWKSLFYMYRVG